MLNLAQPIEHLLLVHWALFTTAYCVQLLLWGRHCAWLCWPSGRRRLWL